MMLRRRHGVNMGREYLRSTLVAEQIMAMPALDSSRRWTAAEVRQLTADNPLLTPRYELVDGELLVTPSPGAPHQRSVAALYRRLYAFLEPARIGEVYFSPSDVELEPEFISQPDLFVVSRAESMRLRREGFPVYALMLAIEVVSPSSGRHDRVRKRPKYQKHTQEYWIVDSDARLFERWRTGDERPEINTAQFEWQPDTDVPAFTLDIERFFSDVFGEEMA
jgi:Uma2 family endonuclease